MPVVILRKQIGDRAAYVPLKTLRHFRALHAAAGVGRQIFQWIVPAPLYKFLPEIFRPVLVADFIAVNERTLERAPGQRTDVIENFLHESVPMLVERGLAEFVAFQSRP